MNKKQYIKPTSLCRVSNLRKLMLISQSITEYKGNNIPYGAMNGDEAWSFSKDRGNVFDSSPDDSFGFEDWN